MTQVPSSIGDSARELTWVRPPLQERSQLTLERVLHSAETLINEVGFDKATVSGIVKGANSSVGAFYTRFKDKDALLRCLLERFVAEASATIASIGSPDLWRESSIRELLTQLLQFSMQELGKRQKLLLAIAQLTTDEPELAGFREKIAEQCAEQVQVILENKGAEIQCKDPHRALRMVSWMSMTLAEASATPGSPYPEGEARDRLVSDICDMALSYLAICEIATLEKKIERKSA